MNRIAFTYNICQLIIEMFKEDEHPIIDYVKRSDEEQKRLFDLGKSKCDGINNISQHQRGRAVDIYFPDLDDIDKDLDKDELLPPKKGFEYWHKRWTDAYGGKPMISWDQGHFE